MSSAAPFVPASAGTTEPLPPLRVRRFPRVVGFLFFVYALAAVSVITAGLAICAFLAQALGRMDWVWWLTRFWSASCLAVAGATVETAFEQPVPQGPVIFVINHQSTFDILALFLGLGRKFVFAAKKSVFSYPFIGWHIAAAGYIKVDRSNRAQAIESLKVAGERIRGGLSVAMFAEGTRSHDGSILPFKKGPFMMALQAGVPLVPVAIEGALQVQPKRRWYVCPNTIRILVGPAIPTAGLGERDRDGLMRQVRSEVIRLHRRLGGLGGDERNAIAAAGSEGVGRAEEIE